MQRLLHLHLQFAIPAHGTRIPREILSSPQTAIAPTTY
jgi:hypothetical protein